MPINLSGRTARNSIEWKGKGREGKRKEKKGKEGREESYKIEWMGMNGIGVKSTTCF